MAASLGPGEQRCSQRLLLRRLELAGFRQEPPRQRNDRDQGKHAQPEEEPEAVVRQEPDRQQRRQHPADGVAGEHHCVVPVVPVGGGVLDGQRYRRRHHAAEPQTGQEAGGGEQAGAGSQGTGAHGQREPDEATEQHLAPTDPIGQRSHSQRAEEHAGQAQAGDVADPLRGQPPGPVIEQGGNHRSVDDQVVPVKDDGGEAETENDEALLLFCVAAAAVGAAAIEVLGVTAKEHNKISTTGEESLVHRAQIRTVWPSSITAPPPGVLLPHPARGGPDTLGRILDHDARR